jgi:hypothetical protein
MPVVSQAAAPAAGCGVRGLCGGLDGVWWQHLPRAAKLPVVQGMLASYQAAYNLGQFNEYSAYLTAYGGPETKESTAFLEAFRNPREVLTFSKSAATYVAEIDRFYATYPSKLTLDVTSVLRCSSDKPMFTCDYVGKFDQRGLLPWPTGP